jgi:hypothetical protein
MMPDLDDVSAYGIVVLTATLTGIVRLVVFGDPGLLHWFGLRPVRLPRARPFSQVIRICSRRSQLARP